MLDRFFSLNLYSRYRVHVTSVVLQDYASSVNFQCDAPDNYKSALASKNKAWVSLKV